MHPELKTLLDGYAATASFLPQDYHRLVIADWLEEHGDARADKVRGLAKELSPLRALRPFEFQCRVLALFPEWTGHFRPAITMHMHVRQPGFVMRPDS